MSEVLEKAVNVSTSNVTVTTTNETLVISSPDAKLPYSTARALVKGWVVLTLGTGTTAVKIAIRRGVGTGGSLIGEANAEQIKTAAGSTEPFVRMSSEYLAGQANVQYSVTIQQVGASGNGTVLEAGIEVELLNG